MKLFSTSLQVAALICLATFLLVCQNVQGQNSNPPPWPYESKSGNGDEVLITTNNSIIMNSYVWVPSLPYIDPPPAGGLPTQFTVNITTNSADGYKADTSTPAQAPVKYGQTGRVEVLTVNFSKADGTPAGTPGKSDDTATAYVFMYNVTVSTKNTGPLDDAYKKKQNAVNIIGIDKLGPLDPSDAKGFLTGAIEFVGTVTPNMLGVFNGGIAEPFNNIQKMTPVVEWRNGKAYTSISTSDIPTVDDSPAANGRSFVSGDPTKESYIYGSDAPGINTRAAGNFTNDPAGTTFEMKQNFLFWFTLKSQQCSEKHKWHIKLFATKQKDGSWKMDPAQSEVGDGYNATLQTP